MKSAALCLAPLLVPAALSAAGIPAAAGAALDAAEPNLKLEVSVKWGELSDSASFLVNNGSQMNYTHGGDKHVELKSEKGRGVEFKKWGFIVNALPVIDPNDPKKVSVQLQLELSGPVGQGEVKDAATWQFQSQLTVRKGKKAVIVEAPARAELTVSDAPVD